MSAELLEIEECISLWLEQIDVKEKSIRVPLRKAYGKLAAEKVLVQELVPPFPKSAMDGYAVKAADIQNATKENPVTLKVIGELCAGDHEEISYVDNSCIRIMTGAFIPQGYDAVVKQEDTDYGENVVNIYQPVKQYQNYCKAGEDMKPGDVICKKREKINPYHLGLMASLGMEEVEIIEPLKVSIISTGSELLELHEKREPGKIYNSIGYILTPMIESAGLEVIYVGICKDQEHELEVALRNAISVSDMVITTGGVSVGKKDLLPEVITRIGGEKIFSRANIQPGTPTIGAMVQEKPLLCLSGNPYAAIANFEIYFWEIAARMMGDKNLLPKIEKAVLRSEYKKVGKLRRFLRAYVSDDGNVTLPSDIHASSVIANMTLCNCFIDLESKREIKVGDQVTIRRFCLM